MQFSTWASSQLDRIRADDRWRQTRSFDARGPAGPVHGAHVISFASNDYLGLSTHPAVHAAAHAALDRWGTGATASRLVVGTRPCHDALEDARVPWKRTERALVFPTGYAANLGVLSALGGPDCLIVSDERNHASIIDGCRLSRSPVAVARHNDPDHVDALLSGAPDGPRHRGRRRRVLDGRRRSPGGRVWPGSAPAMARCSILDEAHAVLGPEMPAADGLELLRVVTLSKALGAIGGAVCGPAPLVDLLVNRARSFIFTTALSPAAAAAAAAAVGVVTGDEGIALVARLRALVDRVRPGHPSPIVPLIVGDEADAVAAADALLAEASSSPPSVRRPSRRAPLGCGSPCRRRTPTPWSTPCSPVSTGPASTGPAWCS